MAKLWFSEEIMIGAKILGNYFSECIDCEIQLVEKDLNEMNGIIGYNSLYSQLKRFRDKILLLHAKLKLKNQKLNFH